jgi:DNA-binding CsgD family transcriptional regulator
VDGLGTRLDGPHAREATIVTGWDFTDVNEQWTVRVENGALSTVEGRLDPEAQATQIGALLHAAEARAQAAAAHAAGGDRPRAVAAAETSRRLAKRCQGAWTPMLRLADAAANHLTPREAEVAALARRGMTNAQIADRLMLSRRTIDSHMQRIYGKLGINRRGRLAEILTLD